MIDFRLRYNFIVVTFIVVAAGFVWLLTGWDNYAVLINNTKATQAVPYTEKVDNFYLQGFDSNQQPLYIIKADNYFNYKNSSAQLINLTLIVYDEFAKPHYSLNSDKASYSKDGKIKFNNSVDINYYAGEHYKISTRGLIFDTKTNSLMSDEKVIYLSEGNAITSEGMRLYTKSNKIKLVGSTIINQNNNRVLTSDVVVDNSSEKEHYYSSNNTTYLTEEGKIYAESMDLFKNLDILKLSGDVKIIQNSNSKVDTKNLIVQLSKEENIYKTKEKVYYQSDIASINAGSMWYNSKQQKIKLSDGVKANYE